MEPYGECRNHDWPRLRGENADGVEGERVPTLQVHITSHEKYRHVGSRLSRIYRWSRIRL